MFTHLHVHTEYSLLDGMCRIPILISKAKQLGMTSLAITDHGCLYGILEFYRQATEAGVKPILGCEVYVAPKDMRSKNPADKNSRHLVLLAKNKTGYHNLLKLATAAQIEGFYYKPRVDWELVSNHRAGLIALSACPQGELGQLIAEGRMPEAEAAALRHKEVFDDFYLELQEHPIPELAQINRELVRLSRKLRIPLVATNDVHYVNQTDAYAHDILLCIQTNNTIQNENRLRMAGDSFYLKSPAEMAKLFADLPEAITATEQIAEICSLELDFGRLHLPEIQLPPGKTAFEQLVELAHQGLARRYREPSQETLDRLSYELEVIRQTEFANYFLVIWDVISFVRERGIFFGVRGSAAASIVLYCLGITDLDPLAHDLVFERFLNIERKEMPDIDLDFQDDRRNEVIAYVASRYGPDRVAQIITFGTLGARAALRDVGRALGMLYSDVDTVARLVPPLAVSIAEALDSSSELRHSYQADGTVKHLIDTATKLEGVARHASTHAAGIVISKDPLTDHVALQRPTRHEEQGISTTQFAMDDIARIGLLKMDFLGLANLTILEKATRIIASHRNEPIIDLHQIPLDDKPTFELLSSGETTGVFQLEGGQMRRFIKELKPTCFADIAAMVALYRPGPKQHIPTFIDAKHGRKPIRFPHPALAEILKETYGVIVYQDQVLLIVQAFAGYTLGEADIVRKAMGKKIPEVMRKEKARFVAGAVKQGFSEDLAQQVWALIEPFAGYAFNKAHSVSYALIAYHTAYLKANYPVEFMCALLSINEGNSEKVAQAVSECQRLGLKVLPPDINRSGEDFTIEESSDAPAIRFGLGAIKNVSTSAVEPLVAERAKSGPFASIGEFCRRADLRNLNKRTLESMIKAGAFDAFGPRGALLSSIDRLISLSQTEQRLKEVGQTTMFDLWGQAVDTPLPSITLPELDTPVNEKLAWEKELLGICLSEHPFMKISRNAASNVDTFCGQISEELVGHVVTTAGIVTAPRFLTTRDKRPFVTAILEDFGGAIQVNAWPEVFQRTRDLWREGNTLLIKGRVKADKDGVNLSCISASLYSPEGAIESTRPQPEPPQPARRITLTFVTSDDGDADVAQFHQIFEIIKQYQGRDRVFLSVITNGGRTHFELPAQTLYCFELHRTLVAIVGEDNISVEQI